MEHLTEIIIAVLSFAGTFMGTIFANNKWIYRIEQLEKKVENHNTVIERMAVVENTLRSHQAQIKEIKEEIHND